MRFTRRATRTIGPRMPDKSAAVLALSTIRWT
jgi:hypothetical protein